MTPGKNLMSRKAFQLLLFFVLATFLFVACEKGGPDSGSAEGSPEAVAGEGDSQTAERSLSADKSGARYPPLPQAIATAEIEDLDGKTFSVLDQKGKVLVLNLWASWCVPCIAEMPHLVEMQEKYQAQGFEVIGLNIGDGDGDPESDEVIESFATKQNLNYRLARADRQLFGEFVRLTQVPAIPQTVIVNREGKMTGIFTGGSARNFRKMKEVVAKTLAESS